MKHPFDSLPRRIFLDSCTAQTLRKYGGYIYEAEPIPASARIHRVTEGMANVEALRDIFLVNQRAHFEWIVSRASMQEAHDKGDPGHMQWLWDIANHSEACLEGNGPTAASEVLAARLDELDGTAVINGHSRSAMAASSGRRSMRASEGCRLIRRRPAEPYAQGTTSRPSSTSTPTPMVPPEVGLNERNWP